MSLEILSYQRVT